ALLARRGVTIIPPKVEEGVAKYPDPSFIARVASSVALRGRDLVGSRILVTAGPTREWIDPVRYISNPSSGLMGLEVALEAYARGAEVDIVYGVTSWEPPHVLRAWHTETTEEMAEKVAELTGSTRYDAIVAAAAPLDFRPEKKAGEKIRSGITLELKLVPTPKVLEAIRFRPKILVAYAAETTSEVDRLIESARAKLEKYQADLVVANVVGSGDVGFSSKYVKAVLVEPGGFKVLDKILKEDLARLLMDHVASRLRVANP
ncbi:MAG: bifunctional phosphopantothenoylcysteine decarboxylase/phosphopantothenate--cysteine ligase CoaBC, partial [Desulfurococcales archaeon]|nr:bifunctional phosphopantothenoylcysteine decarboxylase/phosphopantothenate--cysteine ligase CoaBC [Desulfurococcales archaeon]